MNRIRLYWADGRVEEAREGVEPIGGTWLVVPGPDGREHVFVAMDDIDDDGFDIFREDVKSTEMSD